MGKIWGPNQEVGTVSKILSLPNPFMSMVIFLLPNLYHLSVGTCNTQFPPSPPSSSFPS